MTDTLRSRIYLRCTPREIDVLRGLLFDGADNATLARRLEVDVETVKTYVGQMLRRTQIPNRTALAVAVLRDDLVVIDRDNRPVEF